MHWILKSLSILPKRPAMSIIMLRTWNIVMRYRHHTLYAYIIIIIATVAEICGVHKVCITPANTHKLGDTLTPFACKWKIKNERNEGREVLGEHRNTIGGMQWAEYLRAKDGSLLRVLQTYDLCFWRHCETMSYWKMCGKRTVELICWNKLSAKNCMQSCLNIVITS